MNKIFLIDFTIEIHHSKFRELANFIERDLSRKKQSGCIKKNLYQDFLEFKNLRYIEEWRNMEELEKHIQSPEFHALEGAISVLSEKFEIHLTQCGVLSDIEKLNIKKT
jgi:quinol monooxygenase YgiN